jgi:hypothetical protein
MTTRRGLLERTVDVVRGVGRWTTEKDMEELILSIREHLEKPEPENLHQVPDIIWLQVDPDGEDPSGEFLPDDATWCRDKINDTDVEYRRVK